MSKRKPRKDRKEYFLTKYHVAKPTPREPDTAGVRTLWIRTREEWERLGKIPKADAKPILVPFIPASDANVHIHHVECFSEADVREKPNLAMPEDQKYRPLEPMRWQRHIVIRQEYGAVRNRLQRQLDTYWFVPNPDSFGWMDSDEREMRSVVPKRKTIIYPPALFRNTRKPKHVEERICAACQKPFMARRADARYCGTACRKWASRQPSKKPESGIKDRL